MAQSPVRGSLHSRRPCSETLARTESFRATALQKGGDSSSRCRRQAPVPFSALVSGPNLLFRLYAAHKHYPPVPVTRQVRAGTLVALKRVREPATCEVTKNVPSSAKAIPAGPEMASFPRFRWLVAPAVGCNAHKLATWREA
eukprot:scaffold22820_cov61-Phaeocystis_antarctica.AAC.3